MRMHLPIILGIALLTVVGCESDKKTEPADQNTPAAAEQKAVSSSTPDLIRDGWYDYKTMLLSDTEVPAGYEIWTDGMFGGGRATDRYARFSQTMVMPDRSKTSGGTLYLTIQTLIADDPELLDKFLTEIAGDGSRLHTILDNPDNDINLVVNPAAWIRTEHAVVFMISERMWDERSCVSEADCDALSNIGRSLNGDELAILQTLKDKYVPATGELVEEWQWSYKGL
ncbi:MAG TPA: hypothetical protein PKL83_04740 [bacterium]|nr:hypothetical protein [bacterium]